MSTAREGRLHMLLSAQEEMMLDTLATNSGVNRSELIRTWIHSAYVSTMADVALRHDVLWLLSSRTPLRTTDVLNELNGRYQGTAGVDLGNRIAGQLSQLYAAGFAVGSPAQGYTLTPRGRAERERRP
jgi:hypothetical protein